MKKLMKKLMVFCLTIVMFAMTSSVALANCFNTDLLIYQHRDDCIDLSCSCSDCIAMWQAASPCYDAEGNHTHTDSCTYLLCPCEECRSTFFITSPCPAYDYSFHKDDCTNPLCICSVCLKKNIKAGGGTGFAAVQLDVVRYPVPGGYLKFDKNSGKIIRCSEDATAADIPAQIEGVSVTEIGYGAFKTCRNLTSVTIPNSVTKISNKAFMDCDNLTSVTISNGVTSIGDEAFSGCTNLGKTLTILDSVTSIGEKAFYECKNLTLVTLSKNLSTIPESAFEGCNNLYSIDIPNSVTSISKEAFYNCGNLVKLTIGNNVASIGESAFKDCANLTSVTIPDSVTSIGKEAFSGCLLVKQLTLGNSVASIGDSAFAKCYQLPEVTLPNSVITIGNYAFSSCQLTNAIIPHGVTTIGSHAFDGNKLTVISIPTSVTSIGYKAFPVRIVQEEWGDSYDVYYAGSEEQWALVDKGNDNFFPTERMHFNSTAPGQPSTNPGGTDTPGGNDKPQTVPVTNVTMSTNALNLAIGDNAVLTAKVAPENATNKQVIFTSSNEKVATVDANGKVTALAAGNATITATAGDKKAACIVTVTEKKIPVASVTLDKTALTLEVKTSAQLNATVLPADATNKTVAWTTSNDKVATVDNTGKLTAVGKGNATITATAGDQKSACTVTVTADKVYTITFDTESGTLANGVSNPDYVIKGEKYTMPTATKSGYTLKHWAIGAKDSATTAKANETYTFTADTTVYAVWDRNSTSGGSHSGGNRNPGGTSTTEKPGTTTKPTTPEKPGTSTNKPSGTVTALNIHNVFADVKNGEWYSEAVAYVYNKGMMNGTEKGFEPNASTTRAMLVTMLYRLAGEPATSAANFKDVASGQWFSKAIAWASANGVVNGYADGKFGPNDAITREQLAAVLYRFAQAKGLDVSAKGGLGNFSDSGKVSGWAAEAMQWAVGAGIINGDNGALKPQGNATRAEVAMMIMRFNEM